MRNLKKFLALVLAMVMAFSLMLTANAANPVITFDDSENITKEFEEAVDVLTGMKVFQGDEEAPTMRPGDTITRAEVAALIYRLATGDVDDVRTGTYANYGNFADVSESDWFAGYVGYCANAGYIKGHGGYFNPYDSVTGYETLAMILRAIGYDKNHEFEGTTWETNVSALSTQLGILKNIKTTHYGDTLYLASRRDVVAELLFQADAKVPMVVYTPAFGYQQTGMDGGVIGTTTNPTLGYHIFGLTNKTDGVVIGNQETGEKATIMGYAGEATKAADGSTIKTPVSYSAYTYADTYYYTINKLQDDGTYAGDANADIVLGDNIKYNVGTGIDLMGHEVNIWYDSRSSSYNSTKGYPVYAYFDEATLAEVVKVSGGDTAKGGIDYSSDPKDVLTMRTAATAAQKAAGAVTLYDAMKAAGFSVNGSTEAYLNNSFGRFSLDERNVIDNTTRMYFAKGGAGGPLVEESPEYLYMVVSNNDNKTPDAVIALNIQTSQVTGVDNVNSIKTVTVPSVIGSTPTMIDGNDDWNFIAADNVLSDAASSDGSGAVDGVVGSTLEQGQLVGDSAKTLGQKEIGLHITGTPKDADNTTGSGKSYSPDRKTAGNRTGAGTSFDQNYFKLTAITSTKDGVVVGYNDDSVTLADGTVLEKSIVYDTVVDGTIPQTEVYEHTNYRFYLTEGGKFVGAERMFGAEFIYGTYMDYSQELSTSTFNYYLTGVDLNGDIKTVSVSTLNGIRNNLNSTDAAHTPFRSGTEVNGIGAGLYRGFAYNSGDINYNHEALDTIDVIAGSNRNIDMGYGLAKANVPSVFFDGISGGAGDSIIIDRNAIALGAAFAGQLDMDGDSYGSTSTDDLYFTENTKFILVEGYGTDSLKTQVFNGISELKGDSSEVQINMHYTVDNTATPSLGGLASGTVAIPHIVTNFWDPSGAPKTTMASLSYLTQSPFIYAQNQVLSRQADVIILPAAAVTRTNTSNLRYVGNATPTLVNSNPDLGRQATQFTMYNNGVAENVWVQGLVDTTNLAVLSDTARTAATATITNDATAVVNTGHDHFYLLTDTGNVANDGKPIYSVTLANLAWTDNTYVASTYSAQTGSFTLGATGVTVDKVGSITLDTIRAANNTKMMNVGSANITNLNAGNANPTWPGITNLTTLNEAGSLNLYTGGQYGGATALKVSAIVDKDDSTGLTITQIYICYQQ